jgi:hypothetical protein
VAIVEDDLWREVLGRATEAVSALVALEANLRQSKVGDAKVAVRVKYHVLWLKVTIDNAKAVQVSEGLDELRCVDTGTMLTKLTLLLEVAEKLAPVEEIDHEVELRGGLEGVVQADDVGRPHIGKDLSLSLCLLHQIFFDKLLFFQYLHCIVLAIIDFANKENLCKSAPADDFYQFKIVNRYFQPGNQQVLNRISVS